MNTKNFSILIVTLILLTALFAHARVFTTWSTGRNIVRFITNIGGRSAYETSMNINGQPGHITVFGFPQSQSYWERKMHSISFKQDSTLTTLLGIQLSDKSLLFQIERAEPSASALIPLLKEIPSYPQSIPAFYAHDDNTLMALSVSRSSAPPADIRSFYRAILPADGWHAPVPTLESCPTGMSFYIRGNEVACVSVDKEKISGETRITLLYKKQGIK